ncbi:MAG: methyltransferase domain-containing protein [Betaproteobacteria bacterium]|nr:methyltransferase domain-containing protein [Betaproteobacteria bacterium]
MTAIEPSEAGRVLRLDLLACPQCKGKLEANAAHLVCNRCGHDYAVLEGIPCFASPDRFYDEFALVHCPFAASPSGLKRVTLGVLPFWSWQEWKFWDRVIPRCDRLLDFGCGRGRGIFIERSRETVGYDGSLTFLRDCAPRYSAVALGQLPRLPFASSLFDVVASSHTVGHVSIEDKDHLISEIARVLRPGGVTAHIIETDSAHPAVSAAKRNSQAYRKQFVEQHGHVGLEPAQRVIQRFESHGLRLNKMQLVDAILPSVLNYRTFFDVPDYQNLPEIRWPRMLSRMSAASGIVNAAYEVGMGVFHSSAEQWFGKPERAQFIHVVFHKA